MIPEAPGGWVAALPGRLFTRRFGRAILHRARCGSTNDEAAAWARDRERPAPEGAVVLADAQTRGRGRLGRAWDSPPGANLYLSLVLRPGPRIAPHRAPPLTLLAGVALCEAVEAQGGAPRLKWPNDVLLDEAGEPRKVAGILTEMSTSGAGIEHVVVGIGCNLVAREFAGELRGRATSLGAALGRAVDAADFTARLLLALERRYEAFLEAGPAPVLAEWSERARIAGRHLEVQSGRDRIRGTAEGLDEDGALLLRKSDGERVRVIAGEIVPPETEADATG